MDFFSYAACSISPYKYRDVLNSYTYSIITVFFCLKYTNLKRKQAKIHYNNSNSDITGQTQKKYIRIKFHIDLTPLQHHRLLGTRTTTPRREYIFLFNFKQKRSNRHTFLCHIAIYVGIW